MVVMYYRVAQYAGGDARVASDILEQVGIVALRAKS